MSKKQDLKNEEYWAKVDSGETLVNHLLVPNASASDKIKYSICQSICALKNKSGTDYKTMAKITGKEIIQIKQMTHSHYESFSMEVLVDTFDKLVSSGNFSESVVKEAKQLSHGTKKSA